MSLRKRVKNDEEYKELLEERIDELEDKTTAELWDLKLEGDILTSDAAKMLINRRYSRGVQ